MFPPSLSVSVAFNIAVCHNYRPAFFIFYRDIPECPPAPVKLRPETSLRPRSNLQEEPVCARCLLQQDRRDPNQPIVECPGAPTKGRSRKSILGIKKSGLSKNNRLNRNRGVMPRPVHWRVRRNIIRQLRLARDNYE